MIVTRLAEWVVNNDVRLPKRLDFRLADALSRVQYRKAKAKHGAEMPDLPAVPHGPPRYSLSYLDPRFLLQYPWTEHVRLRPTIVSVPEALVFMPTYAPKGVVSPGYRDPRMATYLNLMHRGWNRQYQSPWTYLDAIDSVFHVLSTHANLVVADFRSSDAFREVLLEHQRGLNAPNYELWFSDAPESPWVALNAVLLNKFMNGTFSYFIHTTSDLIWSQRGWLRECILEMNRDQDCLITYPTVTTAAANVAYQAAPLPEDKDPFTVSLANAYCRIFHRDFFAAYGYRYPDIFRNCYTETFLPFMLDALGKTQKMVPRANCAHCEGLDIWEAEDGTTYAAGIEHQQFLEILAGCKAMLSRFPGQAEQRDHYRQALYMDIDYYRALNIRRFRNGVEVTDPLPPLTPIP